MTALRIEPVLLGDAKLEREPVGKIDEVFVLDHAAGNVGAQPVVAAGEVGSRIVDVIRDRPWRRHRASRNSRSPGCTRASRIPSCAGSNPSYTSDQRKAAPPPRCTCARLLTTTSAPASRSACDCPLRSTPMTKPKCPARPACDAGDGVLHDDRARAGQPRVVSPPPETHRAPACP